MSDPRTAAGQPSPEEMRAYVEQLRAADPAVLVAEAYNLLASGAQVKLGRPDARVLIDAMGALVNATGAALPDELAQQMTQGVSQLQVAQVQAERDEAAGATATATDGAQGSEGTADGASAPTPGGPGAGAEEQRMTDRLWIPGRDPKPPTTR